MGQGLPNGVKGQRANAAQPTMSNEPPIGASLLKLGSLVKAWW